MNKIQMKRRGEEKYVGSICHRIQEKLEKTKVVSREICSIFC